MKNLLPKNPLAAAGVGALIGVGIAGFKMWNSYKEGDVTQKEAVTGVVKQGLLFGGVAAATTLAGGQGGGGVGLAAMSVLGMSGGGGGGGGMLPGMLSQAMGSGGGGRGRSGGSGGMGQGGGGRGGESSGIIDSISDTIASVLVSDNDTDAEGISPAADRGGRGRKRSAKELKAVEPEVVEVEEDTGEVEAEVLDAEEPAKA